MGPRTMPLGFWSNFFERAQASWLLKKQDGEITRRPVESSAF